MLQADLALAGHACLPASGSEALSAALARKPDLAVVDAGSFPADSEVWQWLLPGQGAKLADIILLLPEVRLPEWELNQDIGDLLVEPYRRQELHSRVRRLLKKASKLDAGAVIVHGDLTIDDAGYEVHVARRRVDLTYREYQLLKYLAANPRKVVTRETLLNRVWGYDYFGGDRTVDVHVRRLRSKLEDAEHVFIETVRNVGYRFRPQGVETSADLSGINAEPASAGS
ncbi:MAG: response regulator transcription factor [Chloroflexi bacterium]|nr:response regulator transcription factor [Chloroflexota bacterium]